MDERTLDQLALRARNAKRGKHDLKPRELIYLSLPSVVRGTEPRLTLQELRDLDTGTFDFAVAISFVILTGSVRTAGRGWATDLYKPLRTILTSSSETTEITPLDLAVQDIQSREARRTRQPGATRPRAPRVIPINDEYIGDGAGTRRIGRYRGAARARIVHGKLALQGDKLRVSWVRDEAIAVAQAISPSGAKAGPNSDRLLQALIASMASYFPPDLARIRPSNGLLDLTALDSSFIGAVRALTASYDKYVELRSVYGLHSAASATARNGV